MQKNQQLVACVMIPALPAWAAAQGRYQHRRLLVSRGGRVIACTPMARRHGVEEGMDASRAMQLAEGLDCVPYDAAQVQSSWQGLLRALYVHTPRIEAERLGWAWADPPEAEVLRTWTRQQEVQVGVGPNRSVAALAALRAATGHVLAVRHEHEEAFWANSSAELLPGLGFDDRWPEQLKLFGLHRLDQLQALTKRQLTAQFGPEAQRLHAWLHPAPSPRVALYRPPAAVRVERGLDDPAEPGDRLLRFLDQLVQDAWEGLKGQLAQRVALGLRARGEDRFAWGYRTLARPTDQRSTLRRRVRYLARTLAQPIAEVSDCVVELGGLTLKEPAQAELFARRPRMQAAVEAMEQRFPGMLLRARVRQVAFTEDQVLFEPWHVPTAPAARQRPTRRRRR